MLAMWNNERLLVYSIVPNVFPLTPGKSIYTLGTGGNFNIARPVKIDLAYARDSQGNDYSIQVTNSPDLYASIISKYTSSSIPTVLYDDNNYPLRNITIWPVPSDGTYSLVLWTWQPLTAFVTYSDTVNLPPGYELALQHNLSVQMAPAYGKKLTDDLKEMALGDKAQLKRINTTMKEMGFEAALTKRGLVFNYLTGGTY